jgi:hypothetical protein
MFNDPAAGTSRGDPRNFRQAKGKGHAKRLRGGAAQVLASAYIGAEGSSGGREGESPNGRPARFRASCTPFRREMSAIGKSRRISGRIGQVLGLEAQVIGAQIPRNQLRAEEHHQERRQREEGPEGHLGPPSTAQDHDPVESAQEGP